MRADGQNGKGARSGALQKDGPGRNGPGGNGPGRNGSAGSSRGDGAASELAYHLDCLARLCDELERLADRLPDNVERQQCLSVARSIYPVIRSSHEFEETVIFPRLRRLAEGMPAIRSTLERLHGEHWEDESFGCEVRDYLLSFVAHPETGNAEALAYMLRGFFDSMRRHIAFEREYLIPVLNGDFAPAGAKAGGEASA